MEDIRELLAEVVCDFNPSKTEALLHLIDESVRVSCKVPEGKLLLGEDTCKWYHLNESKDEECWINIPDSIQKCKGRCKLYEKEAK